MAHILIAEDQLAQRLLIKSILEKEGHQTYLAEDGEEALRVLLEHPQITTLITDIDMPRLNGVDLLAELNHRQDLHKIVISSHHEDHFKVKTQRFGSLSFLEKPIRPQMLRGMFQV
ncbi:MAG: response regulator [Deinococcales bacterium]